MVKYFERIIRGQYLNARLILAIDVIVSTLMSFLAILLVKGLMISVVIGRLVIPEYTALAFVASLVVMWLLRTHGYIIRHMMLRDVARFVGAVALKVVLLAVVLLLLKPLSMPALLVVLLADFFITLFTLISLRVAMQIVYEYIRSNTKERKATKRAIVYGFGNKAASLVTRLQASPHYRIVGFLTHGNAQKGMLISNLPVYHFNDLNDVNNITRHSAADVIIFAHREDVRKEEDRLLPFCKSLGVKVLYAPSIDTLKKNSAAQAVRDINIEDLLERQEISMSMDDIIANFKGKTVLVTGAAGSIGSELCRQLAYLGVRQLIMFDNAETPMHNLRLEMENTYHNLDFVPIIGDVRQKERLDFVFGTYKPQVVFHAAAYKHVPLMEENPCEAVLVNVIGSRNVADKCLEYGVEKMVMISTDKAVNPTNVMGCSKRIAEIYVQSLGLAVEKGEIKGKTMFVTTRFGNVLGSNGSVIPRFTEQIANGGPVTVTHPDITRFFMTIPEACKLVLEAATISTGNQIFVFDMGHSVRIAHIAERMIQLAGFTPNVDIKIEYTGLRPGEKLYEEVLSNEENTLPTGHSRIRIAKVRDFAYDEAKQKLEELNQLAHAVNIPEMVKLMKNTVPEFKSNNSPYEKYDIEQVKNKEESHV